MKNSTNALSRSYGEWGSKARKEEDKLRGMRGRALRDHVTEQLANMPEEEDDLPAA